MYAAAVMTEARQSELDEEVLVASSKQGDLEAFNAIVQRYERQVYNLALRMLGDQTLAEDATQEAFFSAFRNIKGFRGGSLRAWLLKIVANASRDLFRSAQRRRDVSLDQLTLNAEPSFPSRTESPEDYTVQQELGRAIQNGLHTIAENQRLVLVLMDIQGLSYEEAAEAAGVSLGTVKSRLSRARPGLRDYLQTGRELLPREFRQGI